MISIGKKKANSKEITNEIAQCSGKLGEVKKGVRPDVDEKKSSIYTKD